MLDHYLNRERQMDQEREHLQLMLKQQQEDNCRQKLKRMCSNKTIQEVSERSNTNTDVTP